MMYKIYLGIGNGEEGFILPVLPEKIEIADGGNNKTYDLINLGEVNVINLPKLTEISFSSYFPINNGPYVSSTELFNPSFYLNKIREWRNKSLKIRFIFVGGPLEINDLFSIENFKVEEHGGEVGDIYFTIDIKRYKSYSAKKVVIVKPQVVGNTQTTLPATVVSSPAPRVSTVPQPKTYTVVLGDTLWAISKRFLGDGNRYKEIATLNNISNPNLIYPGQVFKIPE